MSLIRIAWVVLCVTGLSFAAGRSEVADAVMNGNQAALRAFVLSQFGGERTDVAETKRFFNGT